MAAVVVACRMVMAMAMAGGSAACLLVSSFLFVTARCLGTVWGGVEAEKSDQVLVSPFRPTHKNTHTACGMHRRLVGRFVRGGRGFSVCIFSDSQTACMRQSGDSGRLIALIVPQHYSCPPRDPTTQRQRERERCLKALRALAV